MAHEPPRPLLGALCERKDGRPGSAHDQRSRRRFPEPAAGVARAWTGPALWPGRRRCQAYPLGRHRHRIGIGRLPGCTGAVAARAAPGSAPGPGSPDLERHSQRRSSCVGRLVRPAVARLISQTPTARLRSTPITERAKSASSGSIPDAQSPSGASAGACGNPAANRTGAFWGNDQKRCARSLAAPHKQSTPTTPSTALQRSGEWRSGPCAGRPPSARP